MTRPLAILQRLTLVLAAGAAGTAYAAPSYFSWQTVELPTATGASCSDGSPYRFFVNRTPFSNKTVVVFEGGGACWDQDSCTTSSLLGASNPNGIPTDYMSSPIAQLMTPMTSRLSLLGTVQTQQWNIVYMPYCTGDVHTGNKVGVYSEIDPDNPKVYHHRGALNTEAAAKLSQSRARAVASIFRLSGLKHDRLQALGLGGAQPVASNDSADGRAKNRRVEILVTEQKALAAVAADYRASATKLAAK